MVLLPGHCKSCNEKIKMLLINIFLLDFIKRLRGLLWFWKGGMSAGVWGSTGEHWRRAGSCTKHFQALQWLRGPDVQDHGGSHTAPLARSRHQDSRVRREFSLSRSVNVFGNWNGCFVKRQRGFLISGVLFVKHHMPGFVSYSFQKLGAGTPKSYD